MEAIAPLYPRLHTVIKQRDKKYVALIAIYTFIYLFTILLELEGTTERYTT